MAQKRFHRHFESPGHPLYWIILAYIALAWLFPVIGLIAIICMSIFWSLALRFLFS